MRGFTIAGRAIASTIGHDSHNVCVLGRQPAADMLRGCRGRGAGTKLRSSCGTARSSPRSTCRSAASRAR
ncbi:MAG: adenine deaminase C-terminal domain-containing protein [Collinsella sp.]